MLVFGVLPFLALWLASFSIFVILDEQSGVAVFIDEFKVEVYKYGSNIHLPFNSTLIHQAISNSLSTTFNFIDTILTALAIQIKLLAPLLLAPTSTSSTTTISFEEFIFEEVKVNSSATWYFVVVVVVLVLLIGISLGVKVMVSKWNQRELNDELLAYIENVKQVSSLPNLIEVVVIETREKSASQPVPSKNQYRNQLKFSSSNFSLDQSTSSSTNTFIPTIASEYTAGAQPITSPTNESSSTTSAQSITPNSNCSADFMDVDDEFFKSTTSSFTSTSENNLVSPPAELLVLETEELDSNAMEVDEDWEVDSLIEEEKKLLKVEVVMVEESQEEAIVEVRIQQIIESVISLSVESESSFIDLTIIEQINIQNLTGDVEMELPVVDTSSFAPSVSQIASLISVPMEVDEEPTLISYQGNTASSDFETFLSVPNATSIPSMDVQMDTSEEISVKEEKEEKKRKKEERKERKRQKEEKKKAQEQKRAKKEKKLEEERAALASLVPVIASVPVPTSNVSVVDEEEFKGPRIVEVSDMEAWEISILNSNVESDISNSDLSFDAGYTSVPKSDSLAIWALLKPPTTESTPLEIDFIEEVPLNLVFEAVVPQVSEELAKDIANCDVELQEDKRRREEEEEEHFHFNQVRREYSNLKYFIVCKNGKRRRTFRVSKFED